MMLPRLLDQGTPAIIAILRGIRPEEVLDIGAALLGAGIRIIEVPLNSPQPLASIERLATTFGSNALIGAGTVTSADEVNAIAAVGGALIVSPNTNPSVIARTLHLGLDALPGAMTPTEAFAAAFAGAKHIKLFPGAATGPAHLRALREVLPDECALWAVGGAGASNLNEWLAAGARGIGVGASLYKPGTSAATVGERARELVSAWSKATADLARTA